MNLSTVKWAQWDKTQSRELLVCSYVRALHCAQLLPAKEAIKQASVGLLPNSNDLQSIAVIIALHCIASIAYGINN